MIEKQHLIVRTMIHTIRKILILMQNHALVHEDVSGCFVPIAEMPSHLAE